MQLWSRPMADVRRACFQAEQAGQGLERSVLEEAEFRKIYERGWENYTGTALIPLLRQGRLRSLLGEGEGGARGMEEGVESVPFRKGP